MEVLGRGISRASRAALLGLVGLLVFAASAQADWVEPIAAPLNGSTLGALSAPSIADVGGQPYAAIEAVDADSNVTLEVVHQVGSSWQPVGAPIATGDVNSGAQIVNVNGTLYVVWSEPTSSTTLNAPNEVQVDVLSGDTWVQLAQPTVPSGDDASSPTAADVNNTLWIAFLEGPSSTSTTPGPHHPVVESYNPAAGGLWSVIDQPAVVTPGGSATGVTLLAQGSTTYLAWTETNAYEGQIVVSSETSGTWGTPAVALGSNDDGLSTPELAGGSGGVFLSYGDFGLLDTTGGVLELLNGTWSTVGGALPDGGASMFSQPSIAELDGTPYVAFAEISTDGFETVVKQLSGGAWTTYGSSLTGPYDLPYDTSLATVGGALAVGWAVDLCSDDSVFGGNAFLAEYEPGVTPNTSATACPAPSPPLMIVPMTFPYPYVGSPWSATLAVSGGQPPYTWAISSLPPGLTLDPNTGVVSGTPTASGWYFAPFTVTDADGNQVSDTLQIYVYPQQTTTSTSTSSTGTPNAPGGGQSGDKGSTAVTAPYLGVTVASRQLTVGKAGVASVKITCPKGTPDGSCDGTLHLYSASGVLPSSVASLAKTKKKGKSATLLGTASFSIAAGKSKTVKVHLASAARHNVGKGKLGARLVLVSHDGAGVAKAQSIAVTLRAAAKA